MTAANAPTPGTTRPSALSAMARSAVRIDLGADLLERADGAADVAEAVVEDADAGIHRDSLSARRHGSPSTVALPGDSRVANVPG